MIPASWYAPLPAFLWQVALHSWIVGLLFYAWARRLGLPAGRSRRRLLALLLVLPLVTAAVPGRTGLEFRERLAWLDSGRVLAIPLGAGLRVYHLALLLATMTVALTLWQEVLPALRRPRRGGAPAPEALARQARALPGWEACAVAVVPGDGVALATGGRPGRPRLLVSEGALARLTPAELGAAVEHEHAHWQGGRWLRSHALFLVRLVQCYNPVALPSFREYCLEVEMECDAAAVAGRDPRVLAAALLKVYEATDRRDVAARGALRARIDVLLGRRPRDDDALPLSVVGAAVALLALVLPWLV